MNPKTLNESSVPPSHLDNVLQFVAGQFNIKSDVILHVSDGPDGRMTIGWTGREKPGSPILVKLGLSSGLRYPRVTRHTPETPVVNLSSFQEEVALVLAHELRHAVQIDTGAFRAMTTYNSELDAERYAVRVLERFRASKKQD